jgi:hypothetical protein
MAALDDRPRPGREPTITLEAKAWLVSLDVVPAAGSCTTQSYAIACTFARWDCFDRGDGTNRKYERCY